jgi:hypothetical protein
MQGNCGFAGLTGELVATRLLAVSHEEVTASEGGMIPGLPVQRGNASEFLEAVGAGLDERHRSGLASDNHLIVHEHGLPGSVASVVPFADAAWVLDAGEQVVVEPVEKAVAGSQEGDGGGKPEPMAVGWEPGVLV